ncbi:MAG: TetR/AcrR family transcriptional regulator [Candidatus Binatia bacterium]
MRKVNTALRTTGSRPPTLRAANARNAYDANIDHILRASALVFAEKTYGLATLRDIAERAEITIPRIYYYLRNKEELLYLIAKQTHQDLLSGFAERSRSIENAEERLQVFINNQLEYMYAHPAEVKVLLREAETLTGEYNDEIEALKHAYRGTLRKLLKEIAAARGSSLDAQDIRLLTILLLDALGGTYSQHDPARASEQQQRIANTIFRMAVGGLSN